MIIDINSLVPCTAAGAIPNSYAPPPPPSNQGTLPVSSPERINIKDVPYNAVCDGRNEQDIIQSALNTGAGVVVVPVGSTVGVTGLTILPNQTLLIQGKIKKLSGAAPVIAVSSGSSVVGGEIDGNSVNCTAITGVDCSNVTVDGVYIHDLGQLGIVSYKSTGFPDTWRITNNRIINVVLQSISLDHTNKCFVSNNYIDTTNTAFNGNPLHHGIQFWGGDAKVMANPISVRNITITGNVVKNAKGGIWGSLGSNIDVSSNHVENCTDCGIDFERCENFTCTANSTYDCANGCFAVSYGCKHGTFSGNIAMNRSGSGAAFYAYNDVSASPALPPNQYLTITGNSFTTSGGFGISVQAANNLGLIDSVISGNTIGVSGAVEAIHVSECTKLAITGNQIATSGSPIAIYMDGIGISNVSDNVLSSSNYTSNNPNNGAAITILYRSAAWPSNSNKVTGNIIDGHAYSIGDFCAPDVTKSNNYIGFNHVKNIYRPAEAAYNGVIEFNRETYTPSIIINESIF